MDIFDGLRVVARWWFVTVPLVVLAFGAMLVATSDIQPEYRAEGSVLIVGPALRESTNVPGEFVPLNPLTDQPSALKTVATVVALSIDGPEAAGILTEEGLSSNFVLGTERDAPIVLLETRADTRNVALLTAQRLAELVDEEIRLRQDAADVPADERVTTSILQLASVGGADFGGRSRMRFAVVVFGLALAIGVAFLLEGIRRRYGSGLPAEFASVTDDATSVDPVEQGGSGRSEDADQLARNDQDLSDEAESETSTEIQPESETTEIETSLPLVSDDDREAFFDDGGAWHDQELDAGNARAFDRY